MKSLCCHMVEWRQTYRFLYSNTDYTAYARSVRCSPACMHENACATRLLHYQRCSGRRYVTFAANAVSVHQCRAPATGRLAAGRRSRSYNQPD